MYIFYSHIIGLLHWIIPIEEIGVSMVVQYDNIPEKNNNVDKSIFTHKSQDNDGDTYRADA